MGDPTPLATTGLDVLALAFAGLALLALGALLVLLGKVDWAAVRDWLSL